MTKNRNLVRKADVLEEKDLNDKENLSPNAMPSDQDPKPKRRRKAKDKVYRPGGEGSNHPFGILNTRQVDAKPTVELPNGQTIPKKSAVLFSHSPFKNFGSPDQKKIRNSLRTKAKKAKTNTPVRQALDFKDGVPQKVISESGAELPINKDFGMFCLYGNNPATHEQSPVRPKLTRVEEDQKQNILDSEAFQSVKAHGETYK